VTRKAPTSIKATRWVPQLDHVGLGEKTNAVMPSLSNVNPYTKPLGGLIHEYTAVAA
jgi:hypothetical protein